MELASRRQSIHPRALVGKIILFNGIIFLVVSALAGGYTLFSQAGATSPHGNGITTVTGLLAVIFAGVGVLEALLGVLLWMLPSSASPAATLVDQYYAALTNHEYATAFQYLDPVLGGPLSRMLTQAEFIERAQAYDTQHGQITGYSLVGVQANPSKRVYTIKVTRGSSAYRTRLRLARQGLDWKIVGVDRF